MHVVTTAVWQGNRIVCDGAHIAEDVDVLHWLLEQQLVQQCAIQRLACYEGADAGRICKLLNCNGSRRSRTRDVIWPNGSSDWQTDSRTIPPATARSARALRTSKEAITHAAPAAAVRLRLRRGLGREAALPLPPCCSMRGGQQPVVEPV